MRGLALLVLAELLVIVWLATLCLGSTSSSAKAESSRSVGPAVESTPVSPAVATVDRSDGTQSPQVQRPIEREEVQPTRAADSLDPVGIVVQGTVRDTNGAPVAQASVSFSQGNSYRGGESLTNGAYAAAGLQPGEWQLYCSAEGFGQYETTCNLDARAFQRVDVELRAAYVVKVKIQTPSGEPFVGQLPNVNMWAEPCVVATPEPLQGNLPITENATISRLGTAEWRSATGRASGEADSKLRKAGYAGELRMGQDPPMFASLVLRHVLLQSQRVEPGQHELTFILDPKDVSATFGTLRARLVDGVTGAPLADQLVRLETAQGGGSSAKADSDGRVLLENALPGLGVLSTYAKDREQLWLYVRVPAGGTIDIGEVVLSPLVKITGKVLDPNGKPASGTYLQYTDIALRTWPQPLVTRRSSGVEADGSFTLQIGRHRHVVIARDRDGGFGYAAVDPAGSVSSPVTIEMRKSVRVSYRTQFGLKDGYAVTVLAADRTPISVAWLGGDYRARSTDLPPGNYTLEIHDAADNLVRSAPLSVGTEPLTIEVP